MTAARLFRRIGPVPAFTFAVVVLAGGPARSAPAEVKLDKDFLASLVEKLPPCPFQKEGKYRGTVHNCRLSAIDPRTRRLYVSCQVVGDYRPPIAGALSDKADWKNFRFDVKAGVNIEPGADGTPRFRVEVEEIKRRELEGVPGTLARFLGRYFDEIVTKIAAGKAATLSDKLNRELVRRIELFKQYGVFCGIVYAPDQVVLQFDLTRLRSEGIAGYVFATPQPGTVPFYRWVNPRRGSHFYTISLNEPALAIHQSEGIACYVLDRPTSQAVPLYRWRSPREPFYTTAIDGGGAHRMGYRLEGIACYVFPTAQRGTVPLYRFVDPRNGLHFYTTHPHAEFAK
jgi:hypothetical protein